jgi:hypothetical protein
MIRLKQPALALHSHDVPGYKYKMRFTEMLDPTATVHVVVGKIIAAAKSVPEGSLKNVVINCHGSPGLLHIGAATTINTGNVSAMGLVRHGHLVETIWIVACSVAGGHGIGYRDRRGRYADIIPGPLGAHFCAELAKAAGCYVVAGERTQFVNPGFYLKFSPDNCIDDYEGRVYRWDANGKEERFKP